MFDVLSMAWLIFAKVLHSLIYYFPSVGEILLKPHTYIIILISHTINRQFIFTTFVWSANGEYGKITLHVLFPVILE